VAAIGVDVKAVAGPSVALLPAMLGQGRGRIVHISSGIAGHPAGMLLANAYASSKASLEAQTLQPLHRTGRERPDGEHVPARSWNIRSRTIKVVPDYRTPRC
jgi:NAD(P)-dependent dehydrogenase (short-subunit alcohol dehydrogenase family)